MRWQSNYESLTPIRQPESASTANWMLLVFRVHFRTSANVMCTLHIGDTKFVGVIQSRRIVLMMKTAFGFYEFPQIYSRSGSLRWRFSTSTCRTYLHVLNAHCCFESKKIWLHITQRTNTRYCGPRCWLLHPNAISSLPRRLWRTPLQCL